MYKMYDIIVLLPSFTSFQASILLHLILACFGLLRCASPASIELIFVCACTSRRTWTHWWVRRIELLIKIRMPWFSSVRSLGEVVWLRGPDRWWVPEKKIFVAIIVKESKLNWGQDISVHLPSIFMYVGFFDGIDKVWKTLTADRLCLLEFVESGWYPGWMQAWQPEKTN